MGSLPPITSAGPREPLVRQNRIDTASAFASQNEKKGFPVCAFAGRGSRKEWSPRMSAFSKRRESKGQGTRASCFRGAKTATFHLLTRVNVCGRAVWLRRFQEEDLSPTDCFFFSFITHQSRTHVNLCSRRTFLPGAALRLLFLLSRRASCCRGWHLLPRDVRCIGPGLRHRDANLTG